MKKFSVGFTLIELLIVIAIIAILALIAVPNFLEAQVRAKYSRSLADMRACMTAVTLLQMDTGHLPIDAWDDDTDQGRAILANIFNHVGDLPEQERKQMDVLAVLTSPISYMSSLPTDPFIEQNKNTRLDGMMINTYFYADQDPAIPDWIQAADGRLYNYQVEMLYHVNAGQWGLAGLDPGDHAIIGYGPDKIIGIKVPGAPKTDRGLAYSPTNGTISPGDLILTNSGKGYAP